MRIYTLGGHGMLGSTFYRYASMWHTVIVPRHKFVDATDYNSLFEDIKVHRPDVIVNFVAICDMERCESNPAEAIRVNVQASANSALIASQLGIEYMYISSACVFDGEKYEYEKTDAVNPVSIYGKTKLMGEAVTRTVPKNYIVRSEWCFGGGPIHDTKFIGKIYRQILAGATEIKAVSDKHGSLSYIDDLAVGIEKIIKFQEYGTYHITCLGTASRYEVAKEFVRLIGMEDKIAVTPVKSSEFTKEYFAPRPTSERLVNTPVPFFQPRPWQECLAEYARCFEEDLWTRKMISSSASSPIMG